MSKRQKKKGQSQTPMHPLYPLYDEVPDDIYVSHDPQSFPFKGDMFVSHDADRPPACVGTLPPPCTGSLYGSCSTDSGIKVSSTEEILKERIEPLENRIQTLTTTISELKSEINDMKNSQCQTCYTYRFPKSNTHKATEYSDEPIRHISTNTYGNTIKYKCDTRRCDNGTHKCLYANESDNSRDVIPMPELPKRYPTTQGRCERLRDKEDRRRSMRDKETTNTDIISPHKLLETDKGKTDQWEQSDQHPGLSARCAVCTLVSCVDIKEVIDGLWAMEAVSDGLFNQVTFSTQPVGKQCILWRELFTTINLLGIGKSKLAIDSVCEHLTKNSQTLAEELKRLLVTTNNKLKCLCSSHQST